MIAQVKTQAIPAYPSVFKGIISLLTEMMTVRRQRRALIGMDDAALADIGISRAEALAEAGRPVWDIPRP
jgi:uncharacterized protein YjiS (DUF1127 family)